MAREFKSANLYEFQNIVSIYPFSRRITEVHLHHTWRPRQCDYKGLATIEGMWRYHTENNQWSDIGQHVTVAPNGSIWLCRNFNWAPASARGFNGNSSAGPFMIEMIGDFDIDEEQLSHEQRQATLAVIKAIQHQFSLESHALRFHNEMSKKSCPGTSTNKADWIQQIDAFKLESQQSRNADIPFPSPATRAYELMRGMNPDAIQTDDMSDTEHDDSSDVLTEQSRSAQRGHRELTADILEKLCDHTVNLERGKFSDSGRLETSRQDVNRLFDERLPQEIAIAQSENRKLQLLFYAHGGLVSEKNALLAANKQLPFWLANGVYPIFFIWETGFAETLRQLLKEALTRCQTSAPRGMLEWLTDNISDKLIEDISRSAGGRLIWGGMKSSAELASAPGNGADYVASKMASLLEQHPDQIDVHAAGHSAGSIFHSHFLPLLAKHKTPIKTAQFLAPAVRNDLFTQNIAPLLGNDIRALTLFTMTKLREKDDSVAAIYRKSLLYLVSRALEDSTDTDILGLEESLRKDTSTRTLFGLQGARSAHAEIVWSPTEEEAATGNASIALTHSAFDDDPQTMESVLRRMLDLRNGEPIAPFPSAGTRGDSTFWESQFDWPENLEHLSRTSAPDNDAKPVAEGPTEPNDGKTDSADAAIPQHEPAPNTALSDIELQQEKSDKKKGKKKNKNKKNKKDKSQKALSSDKRPTREDESNREQPAPHSGHLPVPDTMTDPQADQGAGRLTALCIGIDQYQRSPLAGCVADAKLWKRTLTDLGYTVQLIKNEQATARRIRDSVSELVNTSRSGDRLVLQFAGHGTRIKDTDGDERIGDSPKHDECLCAVDCDFADDGLVIDDELRAIIERLPEGVSMTCFFDCCHSGSITRIAPMGEDNSGAGDLRSRYLKPNEQMQRAYRKRVKKIRKMASRAPSRQKDVLFSACRSAELAYESDQQGDFTRIATRVLAEGTQNLSNTDFLERVLQAFGSSPRQHPEIHCDVTARSRNFLAQQPIRQESSAEVEEQQIRNRELESPVDV